MKRVIVFVCTAVLIVSCTAKPDVMAGATAWDGGQARDSLAVEGLSVSRGNLVSTINASGVVSGVNEALAVSETQGIIKRLSFGIGDRVKEGQELLQVDDTLAALNLQRAKDQLDSANLDLRANEQLAESGGGSTAALIRARSAASAAKAQYETSLKTFRDTTVRSPISGIVASREESATVGNIIGALSRVARIVDNSSFKVTVAVGEREIGLIAAGAKALVYVPSALGDLPVEAQVTATGAGADQTTGSFPVVVSFPNKWGDLVKSGMSASVEIEVKNGQSPIVIPVAALVRRDNQYAVFLENGGKAEVRQVVPGRRVGVRTEILSGLSGGETLIVSALARVQNGSPITVTPRGDSASRE